jgi:hypothetical protein
VNESGAHKVYAARARKGDATATHVALKFELEDGAAQMRDRLLSLQKQQLITIEGSVGVVAGSSVAGYDNCLA